MHLPMYVRSLLVCTLLLAPGLARSASAEGAGTRPTPSFADFDRRARAGDPLTVVFFGASLTWGANATDPNLTSYRGVIADLMRAKYPDARFKFFDAAIGGTGSQLGVFRLDRDVLSRKPDLVFLDFTANDGIGDADPEKLSSYESIVRRIIVDGHAPVVQVIFPFKWDITAGQLDRMKRRLAHMEISNAYNTACGDAVALAQERTRGADGKPEASKLAELWPLDGVHPGDPGYRLFGDAAWAAFEQAVKDGRVCAAPAQMLHGDTYMHHSRVRVASLGELPKGWRVGMAHRTSSCFDFLMSRWLDDLAIASVAVPKSAGKPANAPAATPASAPTTLPGIEPLRVKFQGSMVMLFGESSTTSCLYHVTIDGKLMERSGGKNQPPTPDYDAGTLGKRMGGNAHMVQLLATGLDPAVEHTMEIQPLPTGPDAFELRLESICVAGGKATVTPAP